MLVFPQERSDEALGEIIEGYEPLADAITIHHLDPQAYPSGTASGPRSVADLPKHLRNGLAHFNLLPIADGERFAGLRVWNERGVSIQD